VSCRVAEGIRRSTSGEAVETVRSGDAAVSQVARQRPPEIANHLAREFAAEQPNRKWVTDITYIRTAGS